MVLPKDYKNIKYYGRGPHENYSDRKASALLGLYNTTPQDMETEHYVRSQSMGNREDVRWISLTDGQHKGIKISAKNNLNFSALHFSDIDIAATTHDFELNGIRKPEIYLNLDCIQQGLGNASCGPRPLPQYIIPVNTPISYSFRLEPIK
jgi:beta-galactosidase